VHDCSVLNIAGVADVDSFLVGAHHSAEPDGGSGTDGECADEECAGGHPLAAGFVMMS